MAKITIVKGNDLFLQVTLYKIVDSELIPFEINDYLPQTANTDKKRLGFEIISDNPLTFKVDLKNISNCVGNYDFEITLKSIESSRQIRYNVKDLIEVIEYGKSNYNDFTPFYGDEQNYIKVEFKVLPPPYIE